MYKVVSELKPGASTDELLKCVKKSCIDYGRSDYIIIITGSNDWDITKLSSYLYYYLSELNNTNIILCEAQINKEINVRQINKIFETFGNKLPHVNYVDHRYSYLGIPRYPIKHICQNLLQEIFRIEYSHRIANRNAEYIHNMIRSGNRQLKKDIVHSDVEESSEREILSINAGQNSDKRNDSQLFRG